MSSYLDHDPPLEPDPVIEAYKKDVDRTLLRENLKLTPAQRLKKLCEAAKSLDALRALNGKRRRGATTR